MMDKHLSSNRKKSFAKAMMSAALAPIFALHVLSCDTLFTPNTGTPEDGTSIRTEPRGTIEYLFRAYEHKRIDWFMEILPQAGTFRFFISPDYSDIYAAEHSTDAILTRIEDDEYAYVRSGNYHYWNQDSEIAKHRRLFSRAGAIEFTEYPIVDERDFRYRINDDGDTTHVELRLTAGELCITARDTIFCTQKEGQMQVMLLERETDVRTGSRLWVIKDWFDLNTM